MAKRVLDNKRLLKIEAEWALSLIDEALAFEHSAPALLTKATLLAELGRHDEAIASVDGALNVLGPPPEWNESSASSWHDRSDHRAALYGEAYYLRGYNLYQKGELSPAEHDLKRSLVAHEWSGESHATELTLAAKATLAVIDVQRGRNTRVL